MNKKRVLVVDDLPDWRATLKGLLVDEGFDVDTAGTVQSALEVIAENHFDIAILDIRLDEANERDVNGINLAYEIKKLDPNTKIIILTGYASIDLVRRALQPDKVGKQLADSFVEKNNIDYLLKTVKQLL